MTVVSYNAMLLMVVSTLEERSEIPGYKSMRSKGDVERSQVGWMKSADEIRDLWWIDFGPMRCWVTSLFPFLYHPRGHFFSFSFDSLSAMPLFPTSQMPGQQIISFLFVATNVVHKLCLL